MKEFKMLDAVENIFSSYLTQFPDKWLSKFSFSEMHFEPFDLPYYGAVFNGKSLPYLLTMDDISEIALELIGPEVNEIWSNQTTLGLLDYLTHIEGDHQVLAWGDLVDEKPDYDLIDFYVRSYLQHKESEDYYDAVMLGLAEKCPFLEDEVLTFEERSWVICGGNLRFDILKRDDDFFSVDRNGKATRLNVFLH